MSFHLHRQIWHCWSEKSFVYEWMNPWDICDVVFYLVLCLGNVSSCITAVLRRAFPVHWPAWSWHGTPVWVSGYLCSWRTFESLSLHIQLRCCGHLWEFTIVPPCQLGFWLCHPGILDYPKRCWGTTLHLLLCAVHCFWDWKEVYSQCSPCFILYSKLKWCLSHIGNWKPTVTDGIALFPCQRRFFISTLE